MMMEKPVVSRIYKRDGRIVEFESAKIAQAIYKATLAVGKGDQKLAEKLANEVVGIIEKKFKGKIPGVEDVQDAVEEVLIENAYADAARAYIRYRQMRTEMREAKTFFGVVDDLKLGVNAIQVLRKRYLLKNEKGEVVETPSQMFRRVAGAVATVDSQYVPRRVSDKKADIKKIEDEFYQLMTNLEFLPNSPTIMNAGTDMGQLSACFTLPVEDSLKSIFEAVRQMALIHQSGGGTGFSFSHLRPKGDVVRTTKGIASGPVSFMRIFDTATEVVKQGGRRRGANMGILRVDHPDILEFITVKSREGILTNFNLSVAVTDDFMKKVERDEEYDLVNPRFGESIKKMRAKEVFDLIVTEAWRTGDPGLIFIDEINRHNPTPQVGRIESTNPCGEQPLLPYESCNLGSINLSRMVAQGKINWEKLRGVVRSTVHFLDNVIDANRFPFPQIEELTRANRKIGLGVMGFADMLIALNIPYDSDEALAWAEKVMKFINTEARKKSVELAENRGSFPNFKGSLWEKKGWSAMRNASLTTIAPTGSISIIAGTTSGIEPLFAVTFVRDVMEGTKLLEVNPLFEKMAREQGFYSKELMMEIAKQGTIQDVKDIPKDVRRVFVTALDISPEWHVRIQAAFQKYTDNAVSKTINLPAEATPEDVRKVFLVAHKLKCKGVTVYRYGSKKEQVLYLGPILIKQLAEEEHVSAKSEYAGGCPATECPY